MKKEELLELLRKPEILKRTLRFGKFVNPESITDLLKELLRLYGESPDEYIILWLTTTGGSTDQGVSYYEIIRQYQPRLITIASAGCLSAGVPMLLASEKSLRFATEQTTFLIHPTTLTFDKDDSFTESQFREKADSVAVKEQMIKNILLNETKWSEKMIRKIKSNNLHTNVQVAQKYGLVADIL